MDDHSKMNKYNSLIECLKDDLLIEYSEDDDEELLTYDDLIIDHKHYFEIVKDYIDHHSIDDEINKPDHDHYSPLMIACQHDQCDDQVLKLLLDHGADPNSVTPKGETPLIIALLNESLSLDGIELLLKHGSNPNVEWDNFHILHYINRHDLSEIKEKDDLLVKYGAIRPYDSNYHFCQLLDEGISPELLRIFLKNVDFITFIKHVNDKVFRYQNAITTLVKCRESYHNIDKLLKLMIVLGCRDDEKKIHRPLLCNPNHILIVKCLRIIFDHGYGPVDDPQLINHILSFEYDNQINKEIISIFLDNGYVPDYKISKSEPDQYRCQDMITSDLKDHVEECCAASKDVLIQFLIDINDKKRHNFTGSPMLFAIFNRRYDLIQSLLDFNVNPNFSCYFFNNTYRIWRCDPLYLAIKIQSLTIIRLLIKRKAKVERTHVMTAVENHDAECVKLLIMYCDDFSIDLTAINITQFSDEVIDIFLENGSEISMSFLNYVLRKKNVNRIKIICRNDEDQSHLKNVITEKDNLNISFMLPHYINLNVKSLIMAIECKVSLDNIRMIIAKTQVIKGSDVMHQASTSKHPNSGEIIHLLVERGFDVDEMDNRQRTPLMAIIVKGSALYDDDRHLINATTLIDNGTDLNVKDNDGLTPLLRAIIEKNDDRMISLLLFNGSDLGAVDCRGWNAWMLGVKYGSKKLIGWLSFNTISKKLSRKKYLDEGTLCPICMDDFIDSEPFFFKCGHPIHMQCLIQYKKEICPLCRS